MKKIKIISTIIIIVILLNTLSSILYNIKAISTENEAEENTTIIKNDTIQNEIERNNTTTNETTNETINETTNNIENNIKNEAENNIIEDNNIQDNTNTIENETIAPLTEKEDNSKAIKELGISYRTHVENIGWQNYIKNGDVAGTQGKCYRLEALNIKLINNNETNLKIKYQVHVQDIGWQGWKQDDEIAGTQGHALRLEAIKIRLESSQEYSVMYRVHVQDIGWQEWRTDGEIAGTQGKSLRLEAIQIKIVPKVKKSTIYIDTPTNNHTFYNSDTIKVSGWKMSNISNTKIKAYIDTEQNMIDEKLITYKKREDVIREIEGYGTQIENQNPGFEFSINTSELTEASHNIKIILYTQDNEKLKEVSIPIEVDKSLHIQYRSHVENIGWQGYVKDGQLTGTTGLSYRIEAMNISLVNAPNNVKIRYRTHVQDIGWQNWQENGSTAGTIGRCLRIEAIELMLENTDKYTVEYQVHIQDKGWTDWYRDGETAGTIGRSKRIEALRIRIVPKKERRSYKGIDVSGFNGSINWGLVKREGVDFAFIRAGFRGYGQKGTLNEDAYFKLNMKGAQQAGIPVGLYFVTQAINKDEAIEEANWVIERAKNYNIDYPIAIDVEEAGLEKPTDIPRTQDLSKEDRTYFAKLFCETIQKAGYTPIIYCNGDWAYNYLNMSELANYDTWIASHRNDNPNYNGKYTIWQYTSSGRVNGILGNVDQNICYKKY